MPRRPIATSSLLISHAVLVGLTPLIPIPILDDVVKAYVERRLTREVAALHGVTLSDDDVRALAEGPGESIFAQLGRGALLLPVRLLFRKIFFVLELKRASDAASASYHHGYLLDAAFAAGVHPPKYGAGAVRWAIDDTLKDSPHSPIGGAIRVSFEGSKTLVRQALSALLAKIASLRGSATEKGVAEAVDTAEERSEVGTLTDRVRQAIDTVPDTYFEELEAKLLARFHGRVR